MLMEAYYASETMAVEKEMQKRKERCLKRWKKLIIGLRLRSRLQGEYKAGKGEGAAGAAKAGGSRQAEGVSQFQALPDDKKAEDAAPAANTQPPDQSATQNGFIHLDSLDTTVPGGAAFPAVTSTSPSADEPKVDIRSLNLPPMPMPAPAPKEVYNETDVDQMVSFPSGVAQGASSMDLDGFTLAAPDEIADGGEDVHSDAVDDDDAAAGGGFMREEDEEAEKQFKSKDFAQTNGNDSSHAEMEEVAPAPAKRNGRTPKKTPVKQAESDEEEEMLDDGEADYSEPTRPTRSSARKRSTRQSRKQESSAEEEEATPARRSTRSAKQANGTASNSARSARSRPTANARPTRAAAKKAAQANVIDLASDTEGEED